LVIEEKDLLQANATVFASVFIFLTFAQYLSGFEGASKETERSKKEFEGGIHEETESVRTETVVVEGWLIIALLHVHELSRRGGWHSLDVEYRLY
jgi:hypothetical protein